MTKKELMIKAHKMTKEIKAQYPTVDYRFQLGLCLSYLLNEGEDEMIEYKTSRGTSVKVKVEGKNVIDLNVNEIQVLKDNNEEHNCYLTKGFIVINSSRLYKKLGSKGVIRIEMNEELSDLYDNEAKKVREELENSLKDWNRRKSKSDEYYTTSFEKHIKDKNNF